MPEGVTLDKRFVAKASGKDLHRPQLEQLTGYIREGDTAKDYYAGLVAVDENIGRIAALI